jgi:menaquinone-specific isochorismate synthase
VKILPVNPTENVTAESLAAFLTQCARLAAEAGRPQLVSISVPVADLDPLAVLESIFEPNEQHFYAERPAQGFAVAGAEAVLEFSASGENRFIAARDRIAQILTDTIAVGPLDEPFGRAVRRPAFLSCGRFQFRGATGCGVSRPAFLCPPLAGGAHG